MEAGRGTGGAGALPRNLLKARQPSVFLASPRGGLSLPDSFAPLLTRAPACLRSHSPLLSQVGLSKRFVPLAFLHLEGPQGQQNPKQRARPRYGWARRVVWFAHGWALSSPLSFSGSPRPLSAVPAPAPGFGFICHHCSHTLLCPARLVLRWPQPLPFCFRPRSSPQLPPCFPNALSAVILPADGCRDSHCPNRPCFCGEIEL